MCVCVCQQNLALNSPQELICNKTPTNQPPNHSWHFHPGFLSPIHFFRF